MTNMINTICSSYNNDMKENIKSELFEVLLTDKMVSCKVCTNCVNRKNKTANQKCTNKVLFGSAEFEALPLNQKLYYCSRVVKNMAHSSTSAFHKSYRTAGMPTEKINHFIDNEYSNNNLLENIEEETDTYFEKREGGYLDPTKIDKMISHINEKLNQEFEWYKVYYFRMYLLPYPGCNRKTYSLTEIANKHRVNGIEFSRSHIYKILNSVKERVIQIVMESNILSDGEKINLSLFIEKQKIKK